MKQDGKAAYLQKRLALVKQVAQLKRSLGLPIHIAEIEQKNWQRLLDAGCDPSLEAAYQEVLLQSRTWQQAQIEAGYKTKTPRFLLTWRLAWLRKELQRLDIQYWSCEFDQLAK